MRNNSATSHLIGLAKQEVLQLIGIGGACNFVIIIFYPLTKTMTYEKHSLF